MNFLEDKFEIWKLHFIGLLRVFISAYVVITLISLLINGNMTYAVWHYHQHHGDLMLETMGIGLLELIAIIAGCAITPVIFYVVFLITGLSVIFSILSIVGMLGYSNSTGSTLPKHFFFFVESGILGCISLATMWMLRALFQAYVVNNIDTSQYRSYHNYDNRNAPYEKPALSDYDMHGYRLKMEREAREEQENNRQWEKEKREHLENVKNQLYNK